MHIQYKYISLLWQLKQSSLTATQLTWQHVQFEKRLRPEAYVAPVAEAMEGDGLQMMSTPSLIVVPIAWV